MDLHGFYFDVESVGDAARDRRFAADQRPRVVTQLMPPGSTMAMMWRPERAGNWLFHCHVMTHVSPTLHVDGTSKAHGGHGNDHSRSMGMTGMVLGVTVDGPAWTDPEERGAAAPAARKITLLMQREAGRFGGPTPSDSSLRTMPATEAAHCRFPARRWRSPGANRSRSRWSTNCRKPPRFTGTVWSSRATTTGSMAGAAPGPG